VIEGQQKPFFADSKNTINTKVTMLVDHSSSIEDEQLEYKKAIPFAHLLLRGPS
jgi:hypothetical protein